MERKLEKILNQKQQWHLNKNLNEKIKKKKRKRKKERNGG